MTMTFKKTVVVLEGECGVEEAESLLSWLLDNPNGKINMKQATQLHSSIVQLLMCLPVTISLWPIGPELHWLKSIVMNGECEMHLPLDD